MPKRKKKEIVAEAPAFGSRELELLKDTTGVETLDVFKASEKIGRALYFLMIPAGALLSLLSVYGILTSTEFSFSNPLFVGALGFLGAVNIFCGLILLARK
ncbi:MAG: hypothetical protein NWE84_08200 [Candidatus Bathyarchaeota archaeon]|jgi:hypothetical protein|nr:hypothetical protein [Candidatus Bathyarchaeota archaeon]